MNSKKRDERRQTRKVALLLSLTSVKFNRITHGRQGESDGDNGGESEFHGYVLKSC